MATADQALDAFQSLMDTYREFLQLAHDALAPDATPEQREVMREQIKLFLDDRPVRQSQNQPAQE
jgi:hypothetical protein